MQLSETTLRIIENIMLLQNVMKGGCWDTVKYLYLGDKRMF